MQNSIGRKLTRTGLPASLMLAGLMHAGVALTGWAADEQIQTDLGTVSKEDIAPLMKKPGYSPYAGRNFPTRVLWGDTHLHTAISLDAGAIGCTLGPEQAYRFARGEEVISPTGQPAKLARPLDFLVVSDHAEAFGSMLEMIKSNPTLLANPVIKRWCDMIKEGGDTALKAVWS